MNYEEKYKEALERAKRLHSEPTGGTERIVCEQIFPELAESEEEKLRKMLIKFIKGSHSATFPWGGFEREQILAWLEKQGEQNAIVVIPKFRVGDVIRPKGSTAEYTIESISGECYHGKGWGLHISCDDNYELVKQKPTWNEEDEKFFKTALWHISNSISNGKSTDFHSATTDWLKSLKERYTWKPSEKQIMALRWVLNNVPYNNHKEEISGLLEQIKDFV